MTEKKCWFSDRVTDVMCAANYVQKMSIPESEKKILLSLINSDIDKAIKSNLERYKKQQDYGSKE